LTAYRPRVRGGYLIGFENLIEPESSTLSRVGLTGRATAILTSHRGTRSQNEHANAGLCARHVDIPGGSASSGRTVTADIGVDRAVVELEIPQLAVRAPKPSDNPALE